MRSKVIAEIMAEGWPHHATTLHNFIGELDLLRGKLIKQLRREGLYGREPFEIDDGYPADDKAIPPAQ